VLVDIPIRIVNFMSLDTPPSIVDPDAVAGATSLRARYHVRRKTRNHSTDEQFDGESFRLSRRPSGSSGLTMGSALAVVPSDYVDSDAEVEVVVRKASSKYREVALASESTRTESSQILHQNNQTTIQTPAHGQSRGRSKTISSIPQNPSSFVKLARDKLLRMESDPSFAMMASSSAPGSHDDMANLTPSPHITTSGKPLYLPCTSLSSSGSTPGELMMEGPETAGRVQSAPVRYEQPSEQGIRPNAERSQSDTAVRPSPKKAGSDKPSDVRKRIEDLEAKMRGGAK
jgi:hypothetical protein